MKLGIIILAAGKGTRMRSALPKVLHRLAGKPLLQHVIDNASALNPEKIVVVYGHGGEMVKQTIDDPTITWVEQTEQLGTGHAVSQALEATEGMDRVMVLYGDVPLTRSETFTHLNEAAGDGVGVLTALLEDATGYGRIVRNDSQHVERIVEQKDASPEELAIREINSGIMSIDRPKLADWLSRISNDNAQGEYYLTDIISLAVSDGVAVEGVIIDDDAELQGINDRVQLAELERSYQQRQADELMRAGVTLSDPNRFDVRGTLKTGQDVIIDINVIVEGEVTLGNNVTIGANTVLRNCTIGNGTQILENCVIEDAIVGSESRVGPFARLRPGAELIGSNHVGNFVEIKKSRIDEGSKVNHLSYIGDSTIGKKVNVGAGTITCNYDGANKHQTIIGDGAFIGSNSALVAPIEIGSGATIGAGSTLGKDAPEGKLTVSRARQITLDGWQRPQKKAK